jgi:sphingomyelin phosphodiesterase
LDSFSTALLKPNYTCTLIKLCHNKLEVDDTEQFIANVLSTRPKRDWPIADKNHSSIRALVINDLHIDLQYKQGASIECNSGICCRNKDSSTSPIAGKWGALAHCDVPWDLYMHFNSHISDIDPDLIFWLGDNVPHSSWDGVTDLFLENKLVTSELMKKYNKKGVVFPVYGNHEAVMTDLYDAYGGKYKEMYDQMADQWKPWLENGSYESFKKYGYYSQLVPNKKLRIIALNCLPIVLLNTYLIQRSNDVYHQLEWLWKTLLAAENNNEKVIIIGHIAPSFFSIHKIWSRRFNTLIDRFSNIIVGQMYGHTHSDEIGMYISEDLHDLTGIAYVCPSFSTYDNRHPSYRVFNFDSLTYALQDFKQYRAYLDEADWVGHPTWRLAYSFLDYYNMSSMELREINKLIGLINSDDKVFQKYAEMYGSEGNDYNYKTNKKYMKFMKCSLGSATSEEMLKCNGWEFPPIFNEFRNTYFLNLITLKKWYKE